MLGLVVRDIEARAKRGALGQGRRYSRAGGHRLRLKEVERRRIRSRSLGLRWETEVFVGLGLGNPALGLEQDTKMGHICSSISVTWVGWQGV